MFHFGSGGVAWSCNKRNVVALSTTEAEYYGSLNASTEANNYIRGNLLEKLGFPQTLLTTIYCDNHSTISPVHNPVTHNRTKL